MLLTSTENEVVNEWISNISRYHQLLRAHSVTVDVTKLAALRMDVLLKGSSSAISRDIQAYEDKQSNWPASHEPQEHNANLDEDIAPTEQDMLNFMSEVQGNNDLDLVTLFGNTSGPGSIPDFNFF